MNPKQYFTQVVEPNCEHFASNPRSLQMATNAIFSLDAVMGFAFWYLKDKGDASVAIYGDDDSPYKSLLASQNIDYRIIKDAAFALKHGRLTRPANPPRIIVDSSAIDADVDKLSDGFMLSGASKLGGQEVHIELATGKVAAAPLIAGAFAFLAAQIAALP